MVLWVCRTRDLLLTAILNRSSSSCTPQRIWWVQTACNCEWNSWDCTGNSWNRNYLYVFEYAWAAHTRSCWNKFSLLNGIVVSICTNRSLNQWLSIEILQMLEIIVLFNEEQPLRSAVSLAFINFELPVKSKIIIENMCKIAVIYLY